MKVQIGLCERGSLVPVVTPTYYPDVLPRVGDTLFFTNPIAPYGVINQEEWRVMTRSRSYIVVEVVHTFNEDGDILYYITAQCR